jgi:murein DD-endopeptidase MepM/ murein hydrolase activator NlpD
VTLPHGDPSPSAVDVPVDAPWWTTGWVGGLLVAGVAGVVFATGVEVVVPALAAPAPSAVAEPVAAGTAPQQRFAQSAGTPEAPPAVEQDPEPSPQGETPTEAPAVEAPAVEEVVAPQETAVTPEQARAERRKERLHRERRAARELAVIARRTFATWGPITATWVLPVEDYRLSAHYGQTGPHWETIHTGQDFSAPTGTPVRAASQGVVTFAGWDGPYGNKLEITHPDGTVTWYAHLSRIDVAETDAVETGQVVGLVGSTGNSTGPHLHFEVHPGGGDAADPAELLGQHGLSF